MAITSGSAARERGAGEQPAVVAGLGGEPEGVEEEFREGGRPVVERRAGHAEERPRGLVQQLGELNVARAREVRRDAVQNLVVLEGRAGEQLLQRARVLRGWNRSLQGLRST
jgi:hypothetical protein